ncbi:MAG: ABC transporter ATP-binding protein [Rhodospirillales bacterium]|jgi:ABC-type iron transport system FetAB ATPase subunit|nr:ABC transporter ATP-binding protein [Rhodospirillales bacterium]HIJ42857.1 ATP-binding cassette domain-containing protein [Rhodospirillaceae bacterium]HIJ92228.1 ATP-binding cassette domain-containing protein [Rhodospirillaceae bacterium]
MLKVRGLTRPGLGPIDLDLSKGECVALTGQSGAGKTLLLRAIADLDPNDGQVMLKGAAREETPAPEWRRRVSYFAAESGWWEDTVAAHFADVEAARRLLPALGLGPQALNWRVDHLSTGERQRLALVRLLVQSPPVLLLDEPTSALDADTAKAVETEIKKRCEDGAAILIVTHDGEQIKRLAGRRLHMKSGRLREQQA